MNLYYKDGSPFYGIFREIIIPGQHHRDEKRFPIYTIKEKSDTLYSAHEIYMAAQTEYDAALQLVGSWRFWKEMLKASVKIRRLVSEWREEKMLIDQTKARKLMWDAALKGNAGAAKFIYEAKKEEANQKKSQQERQEREFQDQEVLKDRLSRITKLKLA